jgi:hypothetical protein
VEMVRRVIIGSIFDVECVIIIKNGQRIDSEGNSKHPEVRILREAIPIP